MNIFALFEARVADALGRLAEAGQIPAGGTCVTGQGSCATGDDFCADTSQTCNGGCWCRITTEGATRSPNGRARRLRRSRP